MRLISYSTPQGPRVAAQRGDDFIDLNDADPQLPTCLATLLAGGSKLLAQAREAVEKGTPLDPALWEPQATKLPPIPHPGKVLCIGLNYSDHARESRMEPPAEPVVFCKFPSALIAAGAEIRVPAISEAVDYEAELVVVIGQGGKNIAEADALAHVGGYACGHDVSARDWQLQKPGGQWLLGKTFDTFAPVGPVLVTADEIPDPGTLDIRFRLNGETLQDSNTRELIFSVPKLIAYISQVCTLQPGDLIFTGTPAGVGFARNPRILLKPGDVAEVEIAGLGVLRNPVVADE